MAVETQVVENPSERSTPRYALRQIKFSLATILLMITVVALSLALWRTNQTRVEALKKVKQLQQLARHELTVQVEYSGLFVLRVNSKLYAARMESDSAGTVHYEWLSLDEIPSNSYNLGWDKVYEQTERHLKGGGELSEANGNVVMQVGPLNVQWSASDALSGWLYFFSDTIHSSTTISSLEVLRHQIDDLDQVTLADQRHWKRIQDYSSSNSEL